MIKRVASDINLYAVQGAICEELGLTKKSPADVAISRNKGIYQNPEDILLILEVKMSVVWNWELTGKKRLKCRK